MTQRSKVRLAPRWAEPPAIVAERSRSISEDLGAPEGLDQDDRQYWRPRERPPTPKRRRRSITAEFKVHLRGRPLTAIRRTSRTRSLASSTALADRAMRCVWWTPKGGPLGRPVFVMAEPLSVPCDARPGRPRPGAGSRVTDGDAPRRTTSQHKTHSTATCEVHYPWHPWFGNRVPIL